MASQIDPTKPEPFPEPAYKSDLRNNLQAAKDEIEDLQNSLPPPGGTTGQVLKKNSNADFDLGWGDDQTGGSGSGLDFLLPEDFGAVAGNTSSGVAASNETAFQNLFNNAKANGKSIEFHPHRTYYIGDGLKAGPQLVVDQHTDFIIKGNGSKLIRGNGVSLQVGGSSDPLLGFDRCRRFRIYDLIVDGNRDNVTRVDEFGHAFEFWGCYDFTCIACEGNNSQGDGFMVNKEYGSSGSSDARNCKRCAFIECRADRNSRQGFTASNVNGLAIIGGTYNNTEGYTGGAASPPMAGIDLEADPTGIVEAITDVRIIGVHVEGNAGAGIKVVSRWTPNLGFSRRIVVANCVMRRNGINRPDATSFSNPITGLFISGEHVTAVGNVICDMDTKAAGSHLGGLLIYSPSVNVTIAGNVFRNLSVCNTAALTWHVDQLGIDDRKIQSVLFNDNVFDVRTGMATDRGDQPATQPSVIWAKCSGIDFTNNVIFGKHDQAIYGIRASDAASGWEGAVYDNNKFRDIQDPISIGGGIPMSTSYNSFEFRTSSGHTPMSGNVARREEGNISQLMNAARNDART